MTLVTPINKEQFWSFAPGKVLPPEKEFYRSFRMEGVKNIYPGDILQLIGIITVGPDQMYWLYIERLDITVARTPVYYRKNYKKILPDVLKILKTTLNI